MPSPSTSRRRPIIESKRPLEDTIEDLGERMEADQLIEHSRIWGRGMGVVEVITSPCILFKVGKDYAHGARMKTHKRVEDGKWVLAVHRTGTGRSIRMCLR